jgi:5-hydroxyisourate hydrolase-like protein (transthyretin family)
MRALQRTGVGLKVGLGVLLAVVAFSLIWGLCGPSASAVTGASISGHVTDAATGDPLANINVRSYWYHEGFSVWIEGSGTTTDGSGNYDIGGLAAGVYKVVFRDYIDGAYATQYYNGKTSEGLADTVTLAADEVKSGIDAALAAAAHITGRVTEAATGNPVWVQVVAYAQVGSGWELAGYWHTDESGYFDVDGLAAGTYKVHVDGDGSLAGQYYSGKTTLALADPVTLVVGETRPNINMALVEGAHISGRITDSASGQALPEVRATAYFQDGSGWDECGWGLTDSLGDYYIEEALVAGTYVVSFTDDSGEHAWQYYNGKTSKGSADTVPVAAGEVKSGISGALLEASHITGHLTDEVTGGPLRGSDNTGWVAAYIQEDGEWVQASSAVADESGDYDLSGLAAGTYHVGFSGASGFEEVFYNGKASQSTADNLTVETCATVSGIDATLFAGSHITGHVTDAATGVGLDLSPSDAQVFAYRYDGSDWSSAAWASVDSTGDYDIGGLEAGTYHVGFSIYGCGDGFYNGKTTQASATNLTLGSAEHKSGINQLVSSIAPTITSLSPNSGPTIGGNEVIINGTGFSAATTVRFGGTAATIISVTRNQIRAKAPACLVGKVDVTATNPIGTSSIAGTGNDYTYVLRTQETSTSLRFAGSWTSSAGVSYSGGAYKKSASAGGAVAIKFTGNYLAWMATKASSMGIARVTLDYGTPVEVDLYKSSTAYQQKVWATPATLASGTHTLIIEWTGKKNPASTGTYINADAFDTLGSLTTAPLRYQENNAKVIYSTGWTSAASSWASAGTYRYASAVNAKVTVKFTGTSITWVGVKAANYGKAKVTLDGVYKGTIDLYSASTKWGAKLYSVNVPSGNHTLVITYTGTKQTASSGTRISADAFDVLGTLY